MNWIDSHKQREKTQRTAVSCERYGETEETKTSWMKKIRCIHKGGVNIGEDYERFFCSVHCQFTQNCQPAQAFSE